MASSGVDSWMDRRQRQKKLHQLLQEAAEVSVDLDRANGTIVGIPHDSVIESRAHELGRELSRTVQAKHMRTMAAATTRIAKCPECETRCEFVPKKRRLTSVDGPLSFDEPTCLRPRCRRGFFPLEGSMGLDARRGRFWRKRSTTWKTIAIE